MEAPPPEPVPPGDPGRTGGPTAPVGAAGDLDALWSSFAGSPVGTAIVAPDGRIARANEPLAAVLGRSPEALTRSRIGDLVHPADLPAGADGSGPLPPGSSELRWTRRDGTVVWCSTDVWLACEPGGRPQYSDTDGRPAFVIHQLRDVSDRRRAEEALRASENRFRMLVDGVEDYAIYQLDLEGRVASWNVGAERIKGYRAEEVVGQPYRMFFTAEDVEAGVPERNIGLAATEGHARGEGWRLRKGGEAFWAGWTLTALRDGDRLVGFAKITRDLTIQRRAQLRLVEYTQRLEEANRALEAASRMQDDILAVAHHELRTPLTTVIGFAQTLSQSWERLDDERRRVSLQAIESGGRRLQGLVENLLALSALHSASHALASEPVALRTAVLDAAAAVGVSTLEVDVPAGLRVQGDPVRIRQMVANLIDNAFIYGEEPVVVSARPPEGPPGLARLEVTDAGTGVPAEFVPHLFERFSQASRGSTRTSRGTGLGLASVLELARAQGGDAFYEPGPGGGARFVVLLPVAPTA